MPLHHIRAIALVTTTCPCGIKLQTMWLRIILFDKQRKECNYIGLPLSLYRLDKQTMTKCWNTSLSFDSETAAFIELQSLRCQSSTKK